MSVPVLIAVADRTVEAELVAAFTRPGTDLSVVRRCVDISDLIAACSGYAASAALVGSLRGLDRATISRLHAAGLVVVAIESSPSDGAVLQAIGVDELVPVGADAATVTRAVLDAVARQSSAAIGSGYLENSKKPLFPDGSDIRPGSSIGPADDLGLVPGHGDNHAREASNGRLIAVWGPPGSPGRTLLATTLAAELAILGKPVLLIDADIQAASIAQTAGLLDEVPGLAAVTRIANAGNLDAAALEKHARTIAIQRTAAAASLRVLTGLPRADRWRELRPAALTQVLDVARSVAAVTVVDCSASIESDDSWPGFVDESVAPRRHDATLTVLGAADEIIVVGRADPIGVTRLIRGLDELGGIRGDMTPRIVFNRLRRGPIAGDPAKEIAITMQRFAGFTVATFLPEDAAGVDASLRQGQFLAEVAPTSPYRAAVISLARELVGSGPDRDARKRRRGHRLSRGRRNAQADSRDTMIGGEPSSRAS